MRISGLIALGLLLGASRCPSTSAGEPLPGPTAGPSSSYQDPYSGNYGFAESPYAADSSYPTGCAACGYGHPGCSLGYALHHGLPNPHRSTCDMPQHHPYFAEPKFYYYFRPYNWFHIPVQQDDVRAFGGDPRHPYDNRIFKSVYEQLHFNEPAPETIGPPAIPAAPMTHAKPIRENRNSVEAGNQAEFIPASTIERAAEPRNLVRIRRVSHANK